MQATKNFSVSVLDNPILDIWKTEGGEDRELKEYYLTTDAYTQIKDSNKFIIVGRKGSGKSAMKNSLKKDIIYTNNNRLIDFDFNNLFSDDFFNELLLDYNNSIRKGYTELIEFLLIIRLLIVLSDEKNIKHKEAIENFLKENDFILSSFNQISSIIQKKEIITTDSMGINLFNIATANTSRQEIFKDEVTDSLKDLKKNVKYTFLLNDFKQLITEIFQKNQNLLYF